MKISSLQLASGQAGKRAFNCRLLAALLVSVLSSLVPSEQSRAQMVFVDIFPSQDNPTSETLWLFSVSSTAKDSQPSDSP